METTLNQIVNKMPLIFLDKLATYSFSSTSSMIGWNSSGFHHFGNEPHYREWNSCDLVGSTWNYES